MTSTRACSISNCEYEEPCRFKDKPVAEPFEALAQVGLALFYSIPAAEHMPGSHNCNPSVPVIIASPFFFLQRHNKQLVNKKQVHHL